MAFTVKDRYVFSGLSFECFQRTAPPPAPNVHEVGVQTDEPVLPHVAPPVAAVTDTDRLFAAERNREYDAELSRQQFRSQKLVEVLQIAIERREYLLSLQAFRSPRDDAPPADADYYEIEYDYSEYSAEGDDGATANMTDLLHVDEYAAPAPEPSLSRAPVSGTLYGLHVNE